MPPPKKIPIYKYSCSDEMKAETPGFCSFFCKYFITFCIVLKYNLYNLKYNKCAYKMQYP